MTRNTGWGSSSSASAPSRSSGWSQDHHNKDTVGATAPTSPGIGKVAVTEDDFVQKSRGTLVQLFGENFKDDPRYALALADVLEGKRPIHMILADYRSGGGL